MARKPKPGKEGGRAPPKTPVPIVVPKGKKHAKDGRVKRWIRDLAPTRETEPTRDPVEERQTSEPKARETTAAERKPAETPEQAITRDREPAKSLPERLFQGPVQRATIQMLPGRLEPEDPTVIQQEIRFLRASSEPQVVTLGWDLGEPPEHITLNHSSIAPEHAKMTYQDGRWWIESLSRLDPVVVNRKVVRYGAGPVLLENNDEIRIGVVLFRFRFP